jgi:hypothetical protein
MLTPQALFTEHTHPCTTFTILPAYLFKLFKSCFASRRDAFDGNRVRAAAMFNVFRQLAERILRPQAATVQGTRFLVASRALL